MLLKDMNNASIHGGRATQLGPGSALGEVAFFTEMAQLGAAYTTEVTKVQKPNKIKQYSNC